MSGAASVAARGLSGDATADAQHLAGAAPRGWRLWGIPRALPLGPDEQLLWRGGPSWQALASRVMHARLVAGYFVLLTLADMAQARLQHQDGLAALRAAIPSSLTGAGCLLILVAVAYAMGRTTRYAITSRRVIMQFGVALPATVVLPLHRIAAVAVRMHGDRTGDLSLRLYPTDHLGYLKLWPHARPWRFAAAEPMLRDVEQAAILAAPLCRAVALATEARHAAGKPATDP
jgi:hypothetical protein